MQRTKCELRDLAQAAGGRGAGERGRVGRDQRQYKNHWNGKRAQPRIHIEPHPVQPNNGGAENRNANKAVFQRQFNVRYAISAGGLALEDAGERGDDHFWFCKQTHHAGGDHHGNAPPQAPTVGQVRTTKDGRGHVVRSISLDNLGPILGNNFASANHERSQHKKVCRHAHQQTIGDAHSHESARANHGQVKGHGDTKLLKGCAERFWKRNFSRVRKFVVPLIKALRNFPQRILGL